MTINLKNEMIKINELLLLHQKTKVILTKKKSFADKKNRCITYRT